MYKLRYLTTQYEKNDNTVKCIITSCIIDTETHEVVYDGWTTEGVASCHPNDTYNEKEGCKLANMRAEERQRTLCTRYAATQMDNSIESWIFYIQNFNYRNILRNKINVVLGKKEQYVIEDVRELIHRSIDRLLPIFKGECV